MLRSAANNVRGVLGGFRIPPRFPPGHFYSALTNKDDVRRAVAWGRSTEDPAGVAVDHEKMRLLAEKLAPMWPDLNRAGRYSPAEMYCEADAVVYHSMLRRLSPKRVIEVGSGFSTAVALDTSEEYGLGTQVTCIEPYPDRLNSLLRDGDDVHLKHDIVQDVPLQTYDQLEANDILFIDSTHVVKAGSDVAWTTLRVLPRLKPGVVVHIHDMFWPFEYKSEWLVERRDWTEIYFMHAFLSGNPSWNLLFFNDLVWKESSDLVAQYAPSTIDTSPGGLWIQKV